MKKSHCLLLCLSALVYICGNAAPSSVKNAGVDGLPPADATKITMVLSETDIVAKGYKLAVESVIPETRPNKLKVEWKTFTESPLRLPAWFKCTITAETEGTHKFSLYEIGLQGKRHAVIMQFKDGSQVHELADHYGALRGLSLGEPFLVRPMLYWVPDTTYGSGSEEYNFSFTGQTCELYVVYAEFSDVGRKAPKATIMQPADGSPPPANSGNEH